MKEGKKMGRMSQIKFRMMIISYDGMLEQVKICMTPFKCFHLHRLVHLHRQSCQTRRNKDGEDVTDDIEDNDNIL